MTLVANESDRTFLGEVGSLRARPDNCCQERPSAASLRPRYAEGRVQAPALTALVPAPVRHFKQRADLAGVGMMRITLDGGLSRSIPHQYGTVVHLEGESEWSVHGSRYATRPGNRSG